MTLRLGFVGVGRWSRKLAESFRACGAEVVAHDRRDPLLSRKAVTNVMGEAWGTVTSMSPELAGFGRYRPWRDQLADKSIDAIVAVAPPEVTTAVAMACAAAGKPVMATKPLMAHPETIRSVFYIDFWRLWANAQTIGREAERGASYWLTGSGPLRSFPGALDYGPHVMAALLDAAPGAQFVRSERVRANDDGSETYHFEFDHKRRGLSIDGEFGNGSEDPLRLIWGETETPTHIGNEPKEAIMQKFCRSFMSDVSEGFVSTTLLDYSREGMRLLRQIREAAK